MASEDACEHGMTGTARSTFEEILQKDEQPLRERSLAKFNQFLRIEEELGTASIFAGKGAFRR